MPIYEYICDSCETVVEKMQKFSDPPISECESCGGPMRKLISAPGLQFKGSGWYVTDYAGKGKNKNGKSAAPANGGKSDDSGKSKPASDKKSSSKQTSAKTS